MSSFDQKPQYSSDDLELQHSDGESIRIKLVALNNDNYRHAKELAELFAETYGKTPPCEKIVEPDFWYKGSSEEEEAFPMTSIVATVDDRIVAHLGLQQNPTRCGIELLYSAVAHEFREYTYAIAAHYSKFLRGLYRKQRWSGITHFIPTQDSLSQITATKYFRSVETALIAGSHTGPDSARYIVLHSEVTFPEIDQSTSLYPPSAHTDKIIELYSAMNLQRYWQLGGTDSALEKTARFSGAVQYALCVEEKPLLDLVEVRVIPSAVEDEHLRAAMRAERNQYFLVALDDQLCPHACEELQNAGYSFCGVFPEHGGRDFLAYCRLDKKLLESTSLFTEGGLALRDYIRTQAVFGNNNDTNTGRAVNEIYA